MNSLATVSPAAGFTLGDDRFDDVTCLPASVWGFDLRPYRTTRVQARRKRSRLGLLAAVCCGCVGALLLQSWTQYEHRLEHERASAIARQVDALAPALLEMEQWQTLIDAAKARQTWLAALAPRRTRLLRLFDMLAETTRTGVRIVDMQMRQAAGGSVAGVAGVAGAAGAAGAASITGALEQTDASELHLHISGLADDADTLAKWAADLAAQPGVISVDLDSVHRLEDRRAEPQADLNVKGAARNREDDSGVSARSGRSDANRLNAFHLTLVWQDPAAGLTLTPDAKAELPHRSMTLSAPPAAPQ